MGDGMVGKVFQNKFPFMNLKKFMKYAIDDEQNIFGGRSIAPPTVSNPGVLRINKAHWKYKVSKFIGASNPGVGMGAPYLLSAAAVKGIDEMNVCFAYGVQHLSSEMAQRV